jgi:hypothetical protein
MLADENGKPRFVGARPFGVAGPARGRLYELGQEVDLGLGALDV